MLGHSYEWLTGLTAARKRRVARAVQRLAYAIAAASNDTDAWKALQEELIAESETGLD